MAPHTLKNTVLGSSICLEIKNTAPFQALYFTTYFLLPRDICRLEAYSFFSFSAFSKALTISFTKRLRTTSRLFNRITATPSIEVRIDAHFSKPESSFFGRSIYVISPVNTILEFSPKRVKAIFKVESEAFWLSSMMILARFKVRPRIYANGAISMMPRSTYF